MILLRVCLIAFISVLCVHFAFSKNSENASKSMSENMDSNCTDCAPPVLSKGQKWIATEKNLKNIISFVSRKFVRFFDSEDISKISPRCFSSILKIASGFKQLKMWAFKFFDASGILPVGFSRGTLTALGDYDGCLDIDVPGDIKGKSCILEIIPPLPKVMPLVGIIEDVPELRTHFANDTLIGSISSMIGLHYESFVIRLSLCVPSTCTQNDLNFMTNKALKTTNVLVGFDVRVSQCQVKEGIKIEEWNDYASMVVIGLLIVMVVVSTLIDKIMMRSAETGKENSSLFIRIMLCFSMYHNTEKLMMKQSSDAITVFNGMRVVSMLWIVLYHTYQFVPHEAMSAQVVYLDVIKKLSMQPIVNSFPAVDTFFFIGGTLLMSSWMKSEKHNVKYVLKDIIRRYWRLVPPMMLVIALALLVDKAGSGPIWKLTYGEKAAHCRTTWWRNLILINDFYGPEDGCAIWTWYIAADFHLRVVSLIVLLMTKKYPKFSITLLMITSIAALVVNQFYHDLPPINLLNLPTLGDANYQTKYNYFRPHNHAVVYFIGLAVGYALHHKSKIRISKILNIIGWLVSFTAGVTVVYSAYIWYNINLNPSTAVSASSNVCFKVMWSLALGWVTISCCTGNGGFVTRFLSWSIFGPLANLSFVIYIVLPIIQEAYYASSRTLLEADHRILVPIYLSFVFISILLGYLINMLFEAPFVQLDKIMFTRKKLSSNISRDTDGNSKFDCEINGFKMHHQVKN